MVGLVTLGDEICVFCGEKVSEHCDSCGVGLCDDCVTDKNLGIFCTEECLES